MRIDLEVLNSIGHIMTISIMQSGDDGVRYKRNKRVNQRISMRSLGFEFL